MKIEPVNIAIKDDKKYLEVALLVDQDYFLNLIAQVRDWLKDKHKLQTPIPYKAFQELSRELYDTPTLKEIDELIIKKLNWLHVSIAYFRVVKVAIFCHEVRDTDLKLAQLSSDMQSKLRKTDLEYSHFILVTPNVRETDVLASLKRYQDGFKAKSAPYTYLAVPGLKSRAKASLSKYRVWYWINFKTREKLGIRLPMRGFQKIMQEISQLPMAFRSKDESEVKYGIKFYKLLLDKSKTR